MNKTQKSDRNHFLAFLHLENNELGRFGLCALFVFCIGVTQSYLSSVPLSLLLVNYNSTILPYIYVGTALVTLLVGNIYYFFEKRVSFLHLMIGIILGCMVVLVFLWIALCLSSIPWMSIILIVVAWAIYSFGSLTVGCLINQLFTLQQGKRLFGLLAAMQGLGGILAGFTLPGLSHFISVRHFILLAAIALFVAFFLLLLIYQHYTAAFVTMKKTVIQDQKTAGDLAPKSSYINSIFLLLALYTFGYYTLNILLNTVVQQHYPDEIALVSFFGVFYATKDLLKVILSLFAYNMIKRWGIIATICSLPFSVGLILFLAFIANVIPGMGALVFYLIILSQLLDEVLYASVFEKSTLLLVKPLKPVERTRVIGTINIIVFPTATSIIGIILLVLGKLSGFHLTEMGPLVLCIYAAEMLLLLVSIKPNYLQALLNAISKHLVVNPDLDIADKNTLLILKRSIQGDSSEETIYALNALEKISMENFESDLSLALSNAENNVRLYALKKISEHRFHSAHEKVIEFLQKETNEKIFAAALMTLASIGNEKEIDIIKNELENPNKIKSGGAIVGLLKYGSASDKILAKQYLDRLMYSTSAEDKKIAAKLLHAVEFPEKVDALLLLLNDFDAKVRDAACKTSISLNTAELYPALIKNLLTPGAHRHAFASLVTKGSTLIQFVSANFQAYPLSVQEELIRVLGNIHDSKTTSLLLKIMSSQTIQLYHCALQSLEKKSRQVEADEYRQLIASKIQQEAIQGKNLCALLRPVPAHPSAGLLYHFIARELELCRERILALLSFIYPVQVMAEIKKGFSQQNDEITSYAIETLVSTLKYEDRESLLFIFEYSPHTDLYTIKDNTDNIDVWLKDILQHVPSCYIQSIKSVVIFVMGTLRLAQFANFIKEQSETDDALLQETCTWASGKM